MSYTLGIPADGQSLGNSKPQVRGNFTTIFNAFAVNHVALDSLPQGIHKRVDLLEVSTPAPLAGMDTLYAQATSIPLGELFYIRGGSPDVIQMTNGTPVNASSGSTFLPGGMLMQWGFETLNASGFKQVSFSIPFRLSGGNTPPWNIQLTLRTGDILVQRCVYADNVLFDKFDIKSTNAQSKEVYWMAIGPRT